MPAKSCSQSASEHEGVAARRLRETQGVAQHLPALPAARETGAPAPFRHGCTSSVSAGGGGKTALRTRPEASQTMRTSSGSTPVTTPSIFPFQLPAGARDGGVGDFASTGTRQRSLPRDRERRRESVPERMGLTTQPLLGILEDEGGLSAHYQAWEVRRDLLRVHVRARFDATRALRHRSARNARQCGAPHQE